MGKNKAGSSLWPGLKPGLVMYGRPRLGKDFLAAVAIGLEGSCIRPVVRGRLTAGPDGFRGSGSKHCGALLMRDDEAECPDPGPGLCAVAACCSLLGDRPEMARPGWDQPVVSRKFAAKRSGSECSFFVRPEGPFLRPDLGSRWRRAQLRSRLAAGHRRRRRAAVCVSDMSDSSGGESPLCNLMEVKH
jgi:hypothetical protein